MPESTTAEIIRFPVRAVVPPRAEAEPGPADPANARLARALDNLNEALAGQRAAMAAWKTAIGDLRTVTRRLGTSLRGYNDSLGRLDTRVNTLREEAVKLEVWADEALAKKQP